MKPELLIKLSIVFFAVLFVIFCAGGIAGLFYIFGEQKTEASYRGVALPSPVELKPYVPIKGELTLGSGKPSGITGTWVHFRGDDFDAVSKEKIPLKKTPPEKSATLWELPLGEGFAGFAVRNGCVYILDYDMEKFSDVLRCLSFDDGQELWRFSYPIRIKKNHGMSRTIPAVTEKYCVSLGPKCHLLCVDALTGQEKWFIDLKHIYGTTEPEWYAGQCPFIVQHNGKETAIIAPAGHETLFVALDCETGKEVWKTPNPFGWAMTHASVMPMKLENRDTFVYFGKGGVVGVDAADGKILWHTADWQIEIATCPSPLVLPENRIFCSGGYLSGSLMLQIESQNGQYSAKTLYRLKDAVFGSEQQTPIFYDNHIFGIRQRDKQFVCLDLNGNVVWTSGSKAKFGSGPYIVADEMFLILDDDGKLTACEATSKEYRQLFEVQILDDHACWAPMTIVNGRLLLRDQIMMKCLDLRQ
ncbi:dehydrogenase [Planctomycetales bacterium]|nr:dehydrogenase [Planctomycetales bacterium]